MIREPEHWPVVFRLLFMFQSKEFTLFQPDACRNSAESSLAVLGSGALGG
jgi:hypothetical protein